MENFVKRLIKEHNALTEKRNALDNFLSSNKSDKVSKKELLLLGAQLIVMDKYIDILEERLAEHDVEARNGLYKKIITEADVIFESKPELNPDCGALS